MYISCTDTPAILQIIDDGIGFSEPLEKRGMRIRIIHYRARRIDAILDIDSKPHEGTRITLCFNLTGPEKDLLTAIHADYIDLPVLVLSMHDEQIYAERL